MTRKEDRHIERVLKALKETLPEPDPGSPHDVRCAAGYLNKKLFRTACKVSGMRETCRISQNDFSARFKHHMGMAPRDYITHHRIEAAKLLLSDERLKNVEIGEIGDKVGYDWPSSFTTIFTKKVGMSPEEWRKQQ